MAWIALAERPLQTLEILSGLALGTYPFIVDELKKPTLSIFDLIKPLIHLSDDGHVTFVHFTVRESVFTDLQRESIN